MESETRHKKWVYSCSLTFYSNIFNSYGCVAMESEKEKIRTLLKKKKKEADLARRKERNSPCAETRRKLR